ncbi:dihydroxyacetone kinase subunit DhaK [Zophobihabitans entericus]|uniref:Dihydroxyacetone kinase subunit DhaK n=1 Tax=Zophobihabitans entericus TaxID=1635327 RepID=A0A6G9I887_9GAMM|nr:dihydroxyacetone kinase subunit DhaK [Zophobihabitans entericus]QIQ20425.1 dihydroxyacetone kinase subunit DhaK [Zophobihabitans entericus]
MKKIMNQPETMVLEMCHGIVAANPQLELITKYKTIKKRHIDTSKVTLISGGGSGHEPAHAGFIGSGMLDAAVCGDIFASPSQIQVYQAIKATQSAKGTLLIIKNYSGDMMNFQNAAFLAGMDGIKVDYVKVDDDIAVQDSLYTVGRRGVAGTVLVHKIAGAAAEKGLSLNEVKTVASKAASQVRSIGFAFNSCTVPAKGTPTFSLAEDEMEYGVGIHGEPGIRREKIVSAQQLANRMVKAVADDLKLGKKDDIAVLINGFGATPLLELYILNYYVSQELVQLGVKLDKIFVGNYMTSIDMAGASLSVMKLNDELKGYLHAKCVTPAFNVSGQECSDKADFQPMLSSQQANQQTIDLTKTGSAIIKNNVISYENLKQIIFQMGEIIIANEQAFCELDSHAGDGDFGMSVAKGFKQLKAEWNDIVSQSGDIGSFLDHCSIVIMEHCGGASGPIWGFAFKSAAKSCENKSQLTVSDFAQMLQASVKGIQTVGERSFGRGAVVGDKTLIDALVPCADSWTQCSQKPTSMQEAFVSGAKAAVDGAKKTEQITARMGRAGTVGERSIGYPDAGAHALGVIFTEITSRLKFES